MGRKCCVYHCKTNYESEKKGYVPESENGQKIPVFRFPSEKDELDERKRWIDVVSKVNKNLKVSKDTVVCEVHWPKGYPTYRKKGHDRPVVPLRFSPEFLPVLCQNYHLRQEKHNARQTMSETHSLTNWRTLRDWIGSPFHS